METLPEDYVVMYFRVLDDSGVEFRVRRWYSPGDGELEYRGSECDCDAWGPHREIHPEERWCVHIGATEELIDAHRPPGAPGSKEIDVDVKLVDIRKEVVPVQ
ncbi:hypothetical protein [Halopiger aswanensis]|uniref:hypothetical protein n=1 Tax=Halopiger aswanensis TaxID=148449 RepID=UPI000E7125BC|nr:hypothetical protein [Halopiger aswanensis]